MYSLTEIAAKTGLSLSGIKKYITKYGITKKTLGQGIRSNWNDDDVKKFIGIRILKYIRASDLEIKDYLFNKDFQLNKYLIYKIKKAKYDFKYFTNDNEKKEKNQNESSV